MPKENIEPIQPVESTDLFADISKLRLNQSFLETGGAKKILSTVPARKPHKQEFIRVHPGESYRGNFAIIELKTDREIYLVTPTIAEALPGEIVTVTLFTTINRQGVVFLWPVPLPSPDGRVNEWHRSAREHAERAMTEWLRVTANMNLGAYEAILAPVKLPDPEWPDYPFTELLRIGYRDRIISSFDHPVLKRLRGEC
jgi:hypothetical protein